MRVGQFSSAVIACTVGFLVFGHAQATAKRVDIQSSGQARHYDLTVPATGKDYPLLLVFHGGLGSPDSMRRATGLDTLAQRQGFAVAFLAGTGRWNDRYTWNAGGCCAYAMRNNTDDVAYVRAVIAHVSTSYPIDQRRIYLAGLSNGGMLVQILAEALADRVAAAAVVSGPRFNPVSPGRPVPIIIMHATGDPTAPYNGGYSTERMVSSAQSAPFLPVEAGVRGWAQRNACKTSSTKPYAGYQITDYASCAGGATVRSVVINTNGHAWFGGEKAENSPVNATAVVWEFVSAFRK